MTFVVVTRQQPAQCFFKDSLKTAAFCSLDLDHALEYIIFDDFSSHARVDIPSDVRVLALVVDQRQTFEI